MNIQESIRKNRIREGRRNKAERMISAIRLNMFDYVDAGVWDKAQALLTRCKNLCAPRWNQQAKNRAVRGLVTKWKFDKNGNAYPTASKVVQS